MEDNTMKTKKFSKKLVLNKATIAYLNNGEMNAVEGKNHWCPTGDPYEKPTCITAELQTLCYETCYSIMPYPICC
jgi:hypothetical protein